MIKQIKPFKILALLLLLGGCATHIDVSGTFPTPVSHQLPVSSVVVFSEAFRTHRFELDESRELSIAVGQSQVDLFTLVAESMFRESTTVEAMPTSANADLILVPKVEDVQISMPFLSKLKVFEVWIKYNLQVFDHQGEPIADWIMSAYGKTPTKFLKSDMDSLSGR